MAIFSASVRTFSRSRGDSATAAAAYRAGIALHDERLGLTHDYSRRGGVERVRFVVPDDAPTWATDAVRLWNAAEAAEARRNSRVARELIVALPHELDTEARAALAEDIGRAVVDRYGAAAMVAVHAPDKRGDQRNHHAHILFSTRQLGAGGFGRKIRELDDQEQGPREVEALRRIVADLTNDRLAQAGRPERVDERTLVLQARAAEDRGDYEEAASLIREPTRHVGRSGMAVARKGGHDERVATNAARVAGNEAALAEYLARAQSDGRMLAPASDCPRPARTRRSVKQAHEAVGTVLGGPARGMRTTGKDAALLNAQAASAEEGVRVAREGSQAYLDGLRHTAERHAGVVDAYLASVGRPRERGVLLERCEKDPGCVAMLRRSLDARAELKVLVDEIPARRRTYGRAMAATAVAQRTLEAGDAQRPPAWRALSRRQWAEKRRQERAGLDDAVRAERAARSMAAGSGAKTLEARASALRAEIRRIERDRRAEPHRPSKMRRPVDVDVPVMTPSMRLERPLARRLKP